MSRISLTAAAAFALALSCVPSVAQNAAPASQPAPQVGQILAPPGTAGLQPAPAAVPAKDAAKTKTKVKAAAKAAHRSAKKSAAATKPKPAATATDAATAKPAKAVKKPKARGAAAKPVAPKPELKPAETVTGKPLKPLKKTQARRPETAAKETPKPIEAAPAVARLDGDAAWAKIVGNSISGMYQGALLTEAYLPDNTVKSRSNGDVQTGRWGMVDGRICFQYPPETEATCWKLALDGDEVSYTNDAGETFRFTLAPGMPSDM